MPRNGSGVYSLPPGNVAVSQTTILSSVHNAIVQDLEVDANEPRPVSAGGTGATNDEDARTNLNAQAYDDNLQAIADLTEVTDLGLGILDGSETPWSFGNYLINGDFDIWQRGTSFSGGYTADRWRAILGVNSSCSFTRQAFTAGQTDVPGNPTYYMRFARTISSGMTATESRLQQPIEGVQTLSGRTATRSIWLRGSAAFNANLSLRQLFGSGGSLETVAHTESVAVTTSWQQFKLAIPVTSVAGKTIGAGSSLNYAIGLPHAAGDVHIDIAHASLADGDATAKDDPFSPLSVQQVLAQCERYYTTGEFRGIWRQYNASFLAFTGNLAFKNTMRATPSVAVSGPVVTWEGSAPTIGTLANAYATTRGCNPVFNATSGALGATGHGAATITADAEL